MRAPRKRLALTLVMLAAGPALAEPQVSARPEPPSRLTASLDVETQWHLDQSYRLFGTDRTATQSGVSASLVAGHLAGGLLELGAGFHGHTSAAPFNAGQNQAHLEEYTPSLSALLRWAPYRWLEPHLRLAADLTRAQLRLTVSNSATVLEDTVWSPGGSAGVGLRLRTGRLATALNGGRMGIAGALIIEGGFHLGVPYSFSVSPPTPSDEKLANDGIPAGSTPLGDLGRAQPYLRLSFALLI
jgi:hypothetical protein